MIRGYANALDGLKSSEDLTLRRSLLDAFLPYLQGLVGSAQFWEEAAEDAGRFEPDRDWIPPVIVEVVKKLASDDTIPLLESDCDLMLSIVLAVKANAPGISMSDDPMTSAINNSRGMAVEALLQFVLRRCRDADKVEKTHLDVWLALKGELDAEVACCGDGGCLESSTLLASYLAQLIYVDSDWVSENIQRIFSEAHSDNFVCAIAGLSFANANGRLYEILREANVPRRALRSEHIKGSARERLLERIALAYGWGLVEVHSPELAEMFSSDRIDDLIEVASTISRWSSEKISDEQVSRVTDFARSVVAFGLEDATARKKLLRVAARFISFLPSLSDDDMSWLLPIASYAHSSYGSDEFLESLDRLGGKNALNVQRIVEAFLENYEFSDDFRGRLQSIVRKIDQGGRHLEALLIVEQIVKRGGGAQWVALYKELVEEGHRTNLGNE
ncbi:hypothetical protein [Dyella sp. 333MFSha]|uniref:hypothetical protein n=1 Tax=Dyella sp. 333MFSha TaxID=1798240 RepID=UPI00116002F4|nr:hypothetical protein [Dyella sp. 333MFSha]